jgi:hypothetical protein
MTVEAAESLILLTMDSVAHRQNCLREPVQDLPHELLVEALSILEGAGEDVLAISQWFADRGVKLPNPQVPEAKALARTSAQILSYLRQSDEPRTRTEIEANVRGKTACKRTALKNLCASGKVVESGEGCKGNLLRYELREQRITKPA